MIRNKVNEKKFLIAKFFLNLTLHSVWTLMNLTKADPVKGMAVGRDKWLLHGI